MSLDEVTFYINGNAINNVKSYTLKYDLFTGAATFDAEIDRSYIISPWLSPIPFLWEINGYPMMKGFIERVERDYSKEKHILKVSGRDMTQVLIDNYLLNIKPLEDKTIKQIIASMLPVKGMSSTPDNLSVGYTKNLELQADNKTYDLVKRDFSPALSLPNILIDFTPQADAVVSKIKAIKTIRKELGKTLFGFISEMINGAGLAMYNIPGTDTILIHKLTQDDSTPTSFDFDGTKTKTEYGIYNTFDGSFGNNVISASIVGDVSKFYKLTRLYGTCSSETEWLTTGGFRLAPQKLRIDKIEADDPKLGYRGLVKFKTMMTRSVSTEMWVTGRSLIVQNALLQQSRRLLNLKYTLQGHSPQGSEKPYWINTLAYVTDDYSGFSDRFLVYGVEFTGSKEGGQTTQLELCLPGFYSKSNLSSTIKPNPGKDKLSL